jgi:hypothetical protein
MTRSVRLLSTLLVLTPLAAVGCQGGGSPSANYTPSPSYSSQPSSSYASQPSSSYAGSPPAPAQPYTPPQYTPPQYTPPQFKPQPYVPPAAPPTSSYSQPAAAPSAATTYPSSFGWARTLGEAQTQARASKRLIFLESGRETCGNCQKLKKTVVPETSSELGMIAVGYYDDCDVDAGSQAFWILRNNLPNAVTLPLVGFVTPDLQWVSGFSGATDAGRFRSEIDRARAAYRQMGSTGTTVTSDAKPSFGMLPAASSEFAPSTRALASLPSLPDAELADVGAELVADADLDRPAAPTTAVVASQVETIDPGTRDVSDVRSWARDELARAAAALVTRDYSSARSILATVREKARGNPEAREADKGEVAIYNLRKIESTPAHADSLRLRAHHDLRDTVWASLFA